MPVVGGSQQKHKESTFYSYPSHILNVGNVTAHSLHFVSKIQRFKRRVSCTFPDNVNVKLWTIWDVSVKFLWQMCILFFQFWSACSEQKLLAKQKYIITTLADVLSETKLYFSLSFHWEKIKQEKWAKYIDRSKQGKTKSHIFAALYSEII